MKDDLSPQELVQLVRRVFPPLKGDRQLALIVDLPDAVVPDTAPWQARRQMVSQWATILSDHCTELNLEAVHLFAYANPHANNADLPAQAISYGGRALPETAEQMSGDAVAFTDVFNSHQLFIAPTQFSTTAPLKIAAKQYGFRAGTMPGFSPAMIPALRLDYGVINHRVNRLKEILDRSTRCDITFDVAGTYHLLTLDLRFREAHASGGLFPSAGEAGNIPSGESYIVPYEGERPDDPSETKGILPVQFDRDVVLFQVYHNRVRGITSTNEASRREAQKLAKEPAYGNLAELGLGVLGDFGLEPTGEILLDEKLGMHIAFGRSEHFGGHVGPADFSTPEAVIHLDHVYIPRLQPKIRIASAVLTQSDGQQQLLMRDNAYQISFDV